MGEMSAFELGDAAYMLANGSGKNRARADGGLRDPLTWKLLFLSSGEVGLAAHMEQAGKTVKTGQEIRLAEIPADTGKHGLFEELHEFANGSTFADTLSKNAQKYYGIAGREFLKRLTQDIEGAKEFIKKAMCEFLVAAIPEGASGQIHRVAGRFALVAAAGELAIYYNITRVLGEDGMASIGWDEGTAYQAVLKCFQDWVQAFGGPGLQEKTQLLANVRYFLEQHGESRFTDWYANDPDTIQNGSRTYNRAGFRRHTNEGTEFYIFPETFKRDICKGRDDKFVKQTLYERGLLKKDTQGKFTCSAKPVSETKSRRFYVLSAASVED
jgi:putative DNA primase/helicase